MLSFILLQGWPDTRSQADLYGLLRRYKAVVILLFDSSCATDKTKKLKKILSQIVQSGLYPKKAVLFLPLDTTKSTTKLFMQDHDINVAVPAVILIADGRVIRDQNGIVLFKGQSTRSDIKKFIDAYLHVDIAHYIQEERVFKRYKNIIRDRAHVYYTPYFSKVANPWNDWWGWPYYGMAQGNYGGNIGVNFFASNY